MSILRHIIFFIYLFKNAVRVPIWSWASWLVDRVPRNSVFKTFGDKSKCLKYKWWSVNRVTGSWEMSERFSSWVFRGDVCWEGLWLSLRGPHTVCVPWLPSVPVLKSPQEIILFCWVGQKVSWGFSVSSYGKTRVNFLASPIFSDSLLYRSGLGRWSRGEQRWWNSRNGRPTGTRTSLRYFCCSLSSGNKDTLQTSPPTNSYLKSLPCKQQTLHDLKH